MEIYNIIELYKFGSHFMDGCGQKWQYVGSFDMNNEKLKTTNP
jgi:hypothetical protein